MLSLSSIVDKIDRYQDILTRHQYLEKRGGGKKPWSIRYEHTDGTAIDVRGSDWTFYDASGNETMGKQTAELDELLLSKKI